MVEISIPAAPERKNVIHEMVKTPETTVTASKFNTSNLEEEHCKEHEARSWKQPKKKPW